MEKDKVLQMPLAKIHPLLVQKAERKGRTRDELAKGKPMEKILRKS